MKPERPAGKVWPVRVTFPQPDGRGVIPRKWTVASDAGASVFVAERLQKRLIAAGWPVDYRLTPQSGWNGQRIRFVLRLGPASAGLVSAVADLAEIEARRWHATIACDGACCWLVGPHWLDVKLRRSGTKTMRVPALKRGEPSVRPLDDPPF